MAESENGVAEAHAILLQPIVSTGATPDAETLAVTQAGLLQVKVDILDGAHHARRLMGQPARIGVRREHLVGLEAFP